MSVLKKQFVCQRRNGGNCLSRRGEFCSRESSSSPSMSKMIAASPPPLSSRAAFGATLIGTYMSMNA